MEMRGPYYLTFYKGKASRHIKFLLQAHKKLKGES